MTDGKLMRETSLTTEQLRLAAQCLQQWIPSLWYKLPTITFAAGRCLGKSEMHLGEHLGADMHKHAAIWAHVACVILNILDSLCPKTVAVAGPVIFNASCCSTDPGCNSTDRHAVAWLLRRALCRLQKCTELYWVRVLTI